MFSTNLLWRSPSLQRTTLCTSTSPLTTEEAVSSCSGRYGSISLQFQTEEQTTWKLFLIDLVSPCLHSKSAFNLEILTTLWFVCLFLCRLVLVYSFCLFIVFCLLVYCFLFACLLLLFLFACLLLFLFACLFFACLLVFCLLVCCLLAYCYGLLVYCFFFCLLVC